MLTAEQLFKQDTLLRLLTDMRRVAVAFSAGVDSSVVAHAAYLALGQNAVAVTAVSPSLASGELAEAEQLASFIGIRHVVLRTDEFSSPGYIQNAGNRCYFCKSELYRQIASRRDELQVDVICNGANLDDLGDHRPGMLAATEQHVRSPLIEAGCTKQDVRALAEHWGLSVWDKPAMPCLSSRVAYGVEVTAERVQRIDAAETFLKERLGIRELRVRLEANDLARIEVPVEWIPRLVESILRQIVTAHLQELGFKYITLDLNGFRSGSMNDALPIVDLQPLD